MPRMVLMRNGAEYTTSPLGSEMARMGYRRPLLGRLIVRGITPAYQRAPMEADLRDFNSTAYQGAPIDPHLWRTISHANSRARELA
jgi:hypothetical protein